MTYTTHGLMTPMDIAEHEQDHDTALNSACPGHYEEPGPLAYCSIAMECPGESTGSGGGPRQRMGTYERMTMYFDQSANGRTLTARQRRRVVKKAGRDPEYQILRSYGMGYSAARQGQRELAMNVAPVSGAPY